MFLNGVLLLRIAVLESGLADSNGLIDVNPHTLQHKTFENVLAFGSATNLPTTRTSSMPQWHKTQL